MFVVGIFFSSLETNVVELNIFNECEYTTVFTTRVSYSDKRNAS